MGNSGTKDDTEEVPATEVLKVNSEKYHSRPVCLEEDIIFLYGPKISDVSENSTDIYYEIVLQEHPNSSHPMCSLFRAENLESGQEKFHFFKERIPLYMNVTESCSVEGLQKLCDILSKNPTWKKAHLFAHYGLHEQFNDPQEQLINEIDESTGATPLMVAAEACHVEMVKYLISSGCSLDTVDSDGNTIFHYAAASNKEIINILAEQNATSLNAYNKLGYTPLHKSCLLGKLDCVFALVAAGASVNLTAIPPSESNAPGIANDSLYQQHTKYGGTPLHWDISRDVFEALVDNNCDINAHNYEGRTVSDMIVSTGRFEHAVVLLSRGTKLTFSDEDGNTPLHVAVKHTSIPMVQALIVFGTDLEAVNNKGYTARHMVPIEMSDSISDKILYLLHAVGAKRCRQDMSGCGEGCAISGGYNGVPPSPMAGPTLDVIDEMLAAGGKERAAGNEHKQGRLLCLDGGGIRGLVLVQILLKLEEAVGKPIIECFDWVAGTSTGGVLAMAMACKKSLRDCQKLYFRMKDYAFVDVKPYRSKPFENILKDCLGTDTVMSDIINPKLMILALLADRKPADLHIFRNYKSAKDILGPHNGTSNGEAEADSEQLVWEVARATSAAPTFFQPFKSYLDGGLIGNNPTLDALTELTELRVALAATGHQEAARETNLKIVVSCGAGLPVPQCEGVSVPKGLSMALLDLVINQATQTSGRVVERARAWCAELGTPYYRFCPPMSRDVAMDERADEQLIAMLWETQAYMHENKDRVAQVAKLLLDTTGNVPDLPLHSQRDQAMEY